MRGAGDVRLPERSGADPKSSAPRRSHVTQLLKVRHPRHAVEGDFGSGETAALAGKDAGGDSVTAETFGELIHGFGDALALAELFVTGCLGSTGEREKFGLTAAAVGC